jgi:hypothetical protein
MVDEEAAFNETLAMTASEGSKAVATGSSQNGTSGECCHALSVKYFLGADP